MSKKSRKKKVSTKKGDPAKKNPRVTAPLKANSASWKWYGIIALFSFALYANTLGHKYTQDDAIVIYDNMFTTEGFSGIPGILKYDTFYGFFKEEGKANLVSGGRYRPLTLVMFAIGYQFFGDMPLIGHFFNIFYYALLGIIIFLTVQKMTVQKEQKWPALALCTALIFIAHPIHTEAVANIKGRDEIITMLGSISALYLILKSFDTKNKMFAVWAGILIFFACLSKENAVTYLAVIPLTLLFFRKASIGQALSNTLFPILGVIAFIIIRTAVLGFDFGGAPNELMNNPFLKNVNGQYVPFSGSEKLATILFTLGKYVQLLFFPHPLTHDYYPRHVDIMSFSRISVILSLIMYLAMGIIATIGYKKRHISSYAIIYFIITISIISNLVFPIGTNMSERFMFMPSFGFALLLAWAVTRFAAEKYWLPIIGVILLLLSIKTVSRNMIWKDDYTLFTSDISISKNSAKLNNAVGGTKTSKASEMEDGPEKTKLLQDALPFLDKAISIHPTYKAPYLIKGNALYHLKQYKEAEKSYETALRIDPSYSDAIRNSGVNYRELGRYYGEVENNLNQSIFYLKKAYEQFPEDYETNRLLGTAYGFNGNPQESVNYFEKAIVLEPKLAGAYVNLAKAYLNLGEVEKGNFNLQKAKELDPNVQL